MCNSDIDSPSDGALARDEQARDLIRTALETNLLVEAGAGSGKTTELVNRMVGLIKSGICTIEQFAAVTYTRKAAAELRDRFELELVRQLNQSEAGLVRERLESAVRHFCRACIGTVHSFCARLLRERPIEAGVDLNFRELEEEQVAILIERAWSNFVAQLYVEQSSLLADADELGLHLNDLMAGFFPYVQNADIQNWPAGSGPLLNFPDWAEQNSTGKRLADFVARVETLANEFPPEEQRGSDSVMAYYENILRVCKDRDLESTPELIDCLLLFTRETVTPVQKYWPGGKAAAKREEAEYSEFHASVIQPARAVLFGCRYRLALKCYQNAQDEFKRLKLEMRVLDFQDLLILTARLLREFPEVRAGLSERYTHLLVDEFQDTDPLQAEIMFLLTSEDGTEIDWRKCCPRAGSLFVVGDPKQSIYRFKRGDIQTYIEVKNRIAEAGTVCSLTRNFRSCGEVVEWCNQTFQGKFPDRPASESPIYEPMAPSRLNANLEGEGIVGLRRLVCVEKETERVIEYEASVIARQIRKMIDEKVPIPRKSSELEAGLPPHVIPSDFLIIHARRDQLDLYADELRNLGLPVQVTGGSAYTAGIAELELLRDLLTALTEPENPIALVSVLRGQLFGVTDQELYRFRKSGGRFNFQVAPSGEPGDHPAIEAALRRLNEFARHLRTLSFIAALQRITEESGLLGSALLSSAVTSAATVLLAFEKLRELQGEAWSSGQLAESLDQIIRQKLESDCVPLRDQGGAAVRVMNLHRAKGLEAPIVFLANPTGEFNHQVKLAVDRTVEGSAGYLAIHKTIGRQSVVIAQPPDWEEKAAAEKRFLDAEKIRLRYVAATRAGVQLVVSVNQNKPSANPWNELAKMLPTGAGSQLEDPGPQTRPEPIAAVEMNLAGLAETWNSIETRCEHLSSATYSEVSARELESGESPLRSAASEQSEFKGAEWGTLIHQLLEVAVRAPQADLQSLAESWATEAGLTNAAAIAAVATVQSVIGSQFWKRVESAERVLVEVPFTIWEPATSEQEGKPRMVRGVIDLVFREAGGWVICDYKSDEVAQDGLPALAQTYRGQVNTYRRYWEQLTGEPVNEAGLFSTRLAAFQRLAD